MKLFVLTIFLFAFVKTFAEEPINEVLEYSIRFGLLKGGKASISTFHEKREGRDIVQTAMKMQTIGLAHSFYNLNNTYSCSVDPLTCLPLNATYTIQEQEYRYYNQVTFFQDQDSIFSKNTGGFHVPGNVLDLVSLIYNFRFSHQLENLEKGDLIAITFWDIDNIYTLQLKFSGEEMIKTKAGAFKCIKIEPEFKAGSSFNENSPLSIWITNDTRRLPLLIRLNFKFGSVKCELEKF